MWAVQTRPALSHRMRGTIDNSVNVIRYAADAPARGVCVERWDYSEESERFEPTARHELALDGAPQRNAVTSAG